MKLFITGAPGGGKSTIIQNVVTLLREKGYKVGGVSCPEIREGTARLGFKMVELLTGRSEVLSRTGWSSGLSVGKYRVNLQHLPQVGVATLNNVASEADVVIIDEVGPMGLQGEDFQEAVIRVVESSKPVLGIIHWRMRHPVIDKIKGRSGVKIYEVTRESRETVQRDIVEEVSNTLKKENH